MASYLTTLAFAKALVSKQKRRYKERGFNLDLSCAQNDAMIQLKLVVQVFAVVWIPFTDHSPAPTEALYLFCDLAHQWLMEDPKNVLVVHCKAGKGVTIPSQKRYVFYFNELLQHGPRPVHALQLLRIVVSSNFSPKRDVHLRVYSNGGDGSCDLSLIVDSN